MLFKARGVRNFRGRDLHTHTHTHTHNTNVGLGRMREGIQLETGREIILAGLDLLGFWERCF